MFLLFQAKQYFHVISSLHSSMESLLFQVSFEPWSFPSASCIPYLGSWWCVQRLQQGVTEIPKQCILILQPLYIYQEPGVIAIPQQKKRGVRDSS